MLIGYIVGAVGIYSLLYKLSPMVAEDRATPIVASGVDGRVEIIELFADNTAEQRKAA